MKSIHFLLIFIIYACNTQQTSIQYPEQIGAFQLKSVVQGDSAIAEINILHQSEVAAANNIILRYGPNSEDILYISGYKNNSEATNDLNNMISKMKVSKNNPFGFIVPMKKYDKSYMTLGLGSVHYIYQSGNYLLWFSTKQKFYNTLPEELLKYFPAEN